MLRPVTSGHPIPDHAFDQIATDGTEGIRQPIVAARPPHPAAPSPAPRPRLGLNFALRDYLGLAAHPAVRSAALAAMGHHRLAAPDPLLRHGPTQPVLALESRIAGFLGLPAAVSFASGDQAIRVTLRALLRPEDRVIVDSGAHPAMFETVSLAKAQLLRSPAGSVEAVERRLSRLSREPRKGRLIIAVPAISALGSKMADIAELATLARQYDALLIVDATHDLGAMGASGGGVIEIQACTSRVDIVLGSLASTFGASGGFSAFRDPVMATALRLMQWRSGALSPVNAAAILAAFEIIASPEGRRRRRNLHGLSLRLRNHLMADGVGIMGQASPFVPILLPPLTALPRTALLESAGPIVPLLQAPRVPLHAPRWRVQLTADHSSADIDDLAELIRDVTRAFDRQPARNRTLAPVFDPTI